MYVQDVPARYSPQMGWEGANVIFDDWVHPLMMGLEEHLIGMFKHDFEFTDDGHQSHLGHLGGRSEHCEDPSKEIKTQSIENSDPENGLIWTSEGESELAKIPFFVRGKVRRNTEKYARQAGCRSIDSETLYDAKAHFRA